MNMNNILKQPINELLQFSFNVLTELFSELCSAKELDMFLRSWWRPNMERKESES